MEKKGQGALEYLLLIGGAVLVAAIVIALLTSVPGGVTPPEVTAHCAMKTTGVECEAVKCEAAAAAVHPDAYKTVDVKYWSCNALQPDGSAWSGGATFGRCAVGPECLMV